MNRLWIATVVTLLSCLTGCAPAQESQASTKLVTETYGINVVDIGWDVVLYVNDQPAFRGGERSGLWDITQFVVDGENVARLEVTARDEGVWKSGRCEVNLGRLKLSSNGKAIQSEIIGSINERGHELPRALRKQITFTAKPPSRWMWQDAPDIGELTQADRDAIERLVNKLADAYRRRDFKALRDYGTRWAVGDEPVVKVLGLTGAFTENQFEFTKKTLTAIRNYEVDVTPQAKWRFTTGTKLVHVSIEQPATFGSLGKPEDRRHARAYLVYAGFPRNRTVAEDDDAPYLAIDVAYAMRSREGWTLMRDFWARGEFGGAGN